MLIILHAVGLKFEYAYEEDKSIKCTMTRADEERAPKTWKVLSEHTMTDIRKGLSPCETIIHDDGEE